MMAAILEGVTIVLVIAWCATTLLRRASAALRHAVWTCAFLAVLLLAPLRWRMPHRAFAVTAPLLSIASTSVAVTPAVVSHAFDPSTPLTIIWASGTFVMLLRLLRNAVRLRSIMRTARGRFPILLSSRIQGPVVAGLLRPVILLPTASAKWTRERRRAVLAHETAHIRRHDPAILVLSHVVTALYWFHPLIWLAAARLRTESEHACDDAALRTGFLPSGYAAHLLDLARGFHPQLAIPMATTSHLESRVKSILDPKTNRSLPARATWLCLLALTGAVLAPLMTLTLKAQQGAAGIAGTITDPSGARVVNARVIATYSEGGYDLVAQTNLAGDYTFANVPAGHYTIEAQVPGFRTFRAENLVLINGGRVQADARLVVGHIDQSVTVSARGAVKSRATDAALPGTFPAGGLVQQAKVLRQVRPVYPADLQAQGIEGSVILRAVVSKDGTPVSLQVVNSAGHPEFDTAALNAVRQWRYQPTLLNANPIDVPTTIYVEFRLSGN